MHTIHAHHRRCTDRDRQVTPRPSIIRPRSSGGQSTGFLILGSRVRITPGALRSQHVACGVSRVVPSSDARLVICPLVGRAWWAVSSSAENHTLDVGGSTPLGSTLHLPDNGRLSPNPPAARALIVPWASSPPP